MYKAHSANFLLAAAFVVSLSPVRREFVFLAARMLDAFNGLLEWKKIAAAALAVKCKKCPSDNDFPAWIDDWRLEF